MEITNTKYVIVIDGDAQHAEKVHTFLQSAGYGVKSADSIGSLFKTRNDAENIVAVLFDHQGDNENIKQNIKKLKEEFGSETLMVLMHKFCVDALRAAVLAGFNEFLAKPVGKDELLSLLKRKKKSSLPKKISMTIKLEATLTDD